MTRPELGTVGSDITSQTLRLNEAAVWKEPTLLFPQNQASEVAAGNTVHRWEG